MTIGSAGRWTAKIYSEQSQSEETRCDTSRMFRLRLSKGSDGHQIDGGDADRGKVWSGDRGMGLAIDHRGQRLVKSCDCNRLEGVAINHIASICNGPIGGYHISSVIIEFAILRGPSDLCGQSTVKNKSEDLYNKPIASKLWSFTKEFGPSTIFQLRLALRT